MGATTVQTRAHLKIFTPQAAGCWTSLWEQPGIPGAGAAPSSGMAGDIPTDATAGAFPFTNPTGPVLTYLSRLSLVATQVGVLMLYDRLWQQSGLSPTSTSGQTINSVALTRPDALGADAELWLQIYGVMGAGGPGTITAVYTDQGNNGSNTATLQNMVASAAAGRTFPFALAAGDTGVRSVQTYTQSATLTSGTHGLVIRRRLATISVGVSSTGAVLDPIGGGLPPIPDNACLELLWLASGASATTVHGGLTLAQG